MGHKLLIHSHVQAICDYAEQLVRRASSKMHTHLSPTTLPTSLSRRRRLRQRGLFRSDLQRAPSRGRPLQLFGWRTGALPVLGLGSFHKHSSFKLFQRILPLTFCDPRPGIDCLGTRRVRDPFASDVRDRRISRCSFTATTYRCKRRGAVLTLLHDGHREDVIRTKVFEDWTAHRLAQHICHTIMSYHSARHRLPPIAPASVQPTPSPALASMCQRSRVSARTVVHAAGDHCASVRANAMYSGSSCQRLRQGCPMPVGGRWHCAKHGNNGWTERVYCGEGVRRKKEGDEGLLREVG